MFNTLFLSIWFLFHPVHLTLTSIDYSPETFSYKVFVKMYYDDFLLDCKLDDDVIKNKIFSVDKESSVNIMENYMIDNLILVVNNTQISGKLLNADIVDNEIYINLEYRYRKKPKVITIKSLFMTSLYTDQSNMIILKVKDFEEGAKLTSDITEQTFRIK